MGTWAGALRAEQREARAKFWHSTCEVKAGLMTLFSCPAPENKLRFLHSDIMASISCDSWIGLNSSLSPSKKPELVGWQAFRHSKKSELDQARVYVNCGLLLWCLSAVTTKYWRLWKTYLDPMSKATLLSPALWRLSLWCVATKNIQPTSVMLDLVQSAKHMKQFPLTLSCVNKGALHCLLPKQVQLVIQVGPKATAVESSACFPIMKPGAAAAAVLCSIWKITAGLVP